MKRYLLIIALFLIPNLAFAQLSVTQGGTGLSTSSPYTFIMGNNGLRLIASSSPTGGWFTATSTFRASTFPLASTTALSVSGNSYLGTISSGTWNGTAIGVGFGGTGQSSFSVGDTLYASGATTLSKLTIGNSGDVLTINGGVPIWLPPTSSVLTEKWATSTDSRFIQPNAATGIIINLGTSTSATSTNLYVSGDTTLGSATGLVLRTSGSVGSYAGTSCTNQFPRSLNTSGAATCASVANTDLANSTISGVSLGGTLAALTAGTGITSAGTYTGNTARTFSVDQTFTPTWTGLHTFTGGILGNNSTSTITNLLIVNGTTTNATTTVLVSGAGAVATPSIKVNGGAGLYQSGTTALGLSAAGAGLTWDGGNFYPNSDSSKNLGILSNRWIGLYSIRSTTTDATTTSLYGSGSLVWNSASSTITNLLVVNGTTTNATSTNSFASVASSTNLFSQNLQANIKTYPTFTYATSSAWSATTTIALGTAYVAEIWNGVACFTDVGTLNVRFYYNSTNIQTPDTKLNASTTNNINTFTTNNSLAQGVKRYVDIGTPASSPSYISCTISRTYLSN